MKNIFVQFFVTLFCVFIIENVFPSSKDIVVIESYSKSHKWDTDYCKALSEKLGKKYKLTFFEMDTKRIPKTEHEKMAAKAWELIQQIKPILVILGDDAALKFVGPNLENNKIRSVYLGINNNPRAYFENAPKYLTGILERPLIRRSALFIKEIIPTAKNVLIMFDSDRTSEIVYEDFFSSKPSVVFSGINYDIFLNKTFLEWQKHISNAPKKYDAIITGLYQSITDKKGKNADEDKTISWTSQNSKLPLFAFWDVTVGKNKALGGLVITGYTQGKAAAEVAEKLLASPNLLPSSLFPVYLQEGIFLFSNHEVKKFNINIPSDIKKDSKYVD
ncbi:hypothetical protein QEJ31_06370 [Pigmentibacter sp. JX0631]|uniref:ABC transporter substrate-binding protein n=1 Tax=Pigmentibacter sp. JX0631 TaxID=2976982 RepID=UPI00246922E1|nr:hypothetical protein [Pigmentibacter sp. JX0631]WGL61215.1 hypothetical protein QEJ31_06370 [Pigmentibacter sp. JX0631]